MGLEESEGEGRIMRIQRLYKLPGRQGVLDRPVKVKDTNIQIIRPFDGSKIKAVLFDLDGTISKERDGWIDLMVPLFVKELVKFAGVKQELAQEWALEYLELSIGAPTYVQMKALADEVCKRGGKPRKPSYYKSLYNKELVRMVSKHRKQIGRKDLLVPGSLEFIRLVAQRFGKPNLYVGSGTDIGAVIKSMKILGLDKFFSRDNIVGAGSVKDVMADSKEIIIQQLVREKGLLRGELLTLGDGLPEIVHSYNKGGICVGVFYCITGKYKGFFTLERNRQRMINAGAHILVPDFRYAKKLLELICSGWP